MSKLLWIPSQDRIEDSNVSKYIKYVNDRYNLDIDGYNELYKWSIENISLFWESVWDYTNVIASQRFNVVVDDLTKFPGAKWFIGSKLNFAENLLRYRDHRIALMFKSESGAEKQIKYIDLYNIVSSLSSSLTELGLETGDRVAAYMPNIVETPIAMLASASLGGIWSSCGTELGPTAVIDRMGQIGPKILFTVDGYVYKGKQYNILDRIKKIVNSISSIKHVIIIPYLKEKPIISDIPKSIYYDDLISKAGKVEFKQLPPDHPIYIMFSSGTTGKPKCMVQGSAGVLVNHLKELIIHTDLKRDDVITYITTPSWMMWNWLISSLAVGATILLYDGNPAYPDWKKMWRIIEDDQVTIFGCSATYINYLRSVGAEPGKEFNLDHLKEISQTGSPLSPDGFRYVYESIRKDLHFNSISGGTDINGCFAAGTPIQPVYAGELQGPALGMKIEAYDEHANPVRDKPGELVCEAPAPSMPLYFWNDPDGSRYWNTYFSYYSKYKNVWRHGDLIIIHSDTGGITFLGRSDYTLKPSGVRIGPAEIYNVVEKLEEISDSLAIGQRWKGDERIILFVKLKEGYKLDENLKKKIRNILREEASPRHVPAIIIEAPDIPYTYNMKKVESAVYNIIHGKPVTNEDALINPESLKFYREIAEKLWEK